MAAVSAVAIGSELYNPATLWKHDSKVMMMRCFFSLARVIVFGLCAAVCGLGLGCGGESKPVTPGLVSVTGTVTLNGKPLSGGNIMFAPTKSEIKRSPNSVIDAEGKYDLAWSQDEMGALPGTYKVIVIYKEGVVSEENPSPKSLIPTKYGNVATTDLSAVVTADGENNFPFDLKP